MNIQANKLKYTRWTERLMTYMLLNDGGYKLLDGAQTRLIYYSYILLDTHTHTHIKLHTDGSSNDGLAKPVCNDLWSFFNIYKQYG